jgi:hypothetical protein
MMGMCLKKQGKQGYETRQFCATCHVCAVGSRNADGRVSQHRHIPYYLTYLVVHASWYDPKLLHARHFVCGCAAPNYIHAWYDVDM